MNIEKKVLLYGFIIAFITIVFLSLVYQTVGAQSLDPTSVPTPSNLISEPTITQEPWPTKAVPTPRPYDWCNENGCGYNQYYKLPDHNSGSGSFESVYVGQKQSQNQSPTPTLIPTQESAVKGDTAFPKISSAPVKSSQKLSSTISPKPKMSTPSAIPTKKSSSISQKQQSFMTKVWSLILGFFGYRK
jgi:hypothetical protein